MAGFKERNVGCTHQSNPDWNTAVRQSAYTLDKYMTVASDDTTTRAKESYHRLPYSCSFNLKGEKVKCL